MKGKKEKKGPKFKLSKHIVPVGERQRMLREKMSGSWVKPRRKKKQKRPIVANAAPVKPGAKKPQKHRSLQKQKTKITQLNGNYKRYLRTVWWKQRRLKFLKDNPSCVLCGRDESLEVHHVRYSCKGQSVLFQEKDRDLRTSCTDCHLKAHYYKMEIIFTSSGEKFRKLHHEFSRLPVPSRHKPGDDVTFSAPEVDLPWDLSP